MDGVFATQSREHGVPSGTMFEAKMGGIHLIRPLHKDHKLWRYVDFQKLVLLLQRKALWLNRLDQFQDPFEGALPKSVLDVLSSLTVTELDNGTFSYESWRKRGCANCWFM